MKRIWIYQDRETYPISQMEIYLVEEAAAAMVIDKVIRDDGTKILAEES